MRYLLIFFLLLSTLSYSQEIFIPNSFTPNNDGVNDHFGAFCSETDTISYYELLIFNSDGKMVFNTNNICDKWLGGYDYYNSSRSFVYKVQYKFTTDKFIKSKIGFVYLIR